MNLFKLAEKKLNFKFSLILCIIHITFFLFIVRQVIENSIDAQWQLTWLFMFIIDFPISLLLAPFLFLYPHQHISFLNYPFNEVKDFLIPFFFYGILGSTWYFFIPKIITYIIRKIR